MSYSRLVARVLASLGCLVVVTIATMGLPIARLYLATALFSVLLLYLFNRPYLFDLPVIALMGFAAVKLHMWVWAGAVDFNTVLAGAGLGMATFVVLLVRLVWAGNNDERQRILNVLTPSTVLTILLFCTHNMLNLTGIIHPKTFDLYALSFDGSLGFQPSFWLGQRFENVHWFGFIGNESYLAILLAMAVAHILHSKWRPQKISRFFMLELFFAAGFIGYLVYQLFPAAGPAYAYPGIFPQHPLTYAQMKHLLVEPIALGMNIARNAMPSLHMSWALAVWWNLRNFRKPVAWGGFVFALLTVIATLGTGEHYLVDLVVSFPFTMCFQAIASRHLPFSRRVKPIVVGALLTLAWLLMLRYELHVFWISPVIPWAAIAITVGTTLFMVWPLTSFEGLAEEKAVPELAQVATV
ncbi:MAG: phosphatase PAP2 family protein [Terriglobales bacterium]